jgi:hypothetical protein
VSRALRNHIPRRFRNHAGARGRWYRTQLGVLEERFGPFDAFTREYAADVAKLWCEWHSDTRALEVAERERAHGKGRRPNTAAIRALKKRAGLSRGTYEAALKRLEDFAANRPAGDLLLAMRDAR